MSDWMDKVHAHADGELAGDEKVQVDALIASDPRAAAEHQWATYTRELLSTKCSTPDSSEVWRLCVARLDAIDALQGDGRVNTFVTRYGWGLAACLFVVILLAGFLSRGRATSLSDRELAGLFTGSPLTAQQSVDGADEADVIVRRELNTNLPQIAPVVQVVRVGKGRVDGRSFLQVDLLDNSGPFRLYLVQGASDFDSLDSISGRSQFFGGQVNGLECVGWTANGITYLLVAERSVDELLLIADRMQG